MMLPVLAINTAFHPSLFLVNLAFIVLQLMLLVCFILAKYAIYAPNKKLESNSVILSVAGLGTIIPFLLPIPLVLILFNYRKAIRTLKPYFDD